VSEIAQVVETNAKKVGKAVGEGAGKAIHDFLQDTKARLVKNVEAHEEHDRTAASDLEKAAQHSDETPTVHGESSTTPQSVSGGSTTSVPTVEDINGGGAGTPHSVSGGSTTDVPDVDAINTGHDPGTSTGSGRSTTADEMAEAQRNVDQGARTFADDDEAMQYGGNEWNDYAENLPPEQRAAVYNYTTDPPHEANYREINGALRRGDTSDPTISHNIDELDKALAGHPTPENVVVSRGTGISHFPVDDPSQMTGRTVHDDAYTSASLGGPASVFAGMDGVLHLQVPAGTPALWVEKVSHYGAGEREILLGRDSSYVVDHGMLGDDGKWHIYGHYLPTGGGSS
jgi:hypothetical protein